MTEAELRAQLVELAASLFQRGFSVGSAGNISAKLADGYLMTPTNASLRVRLRAGGGRLERQVVLRQGGTEPNATGSLVATLEAL